MTEYLTAHQFLAIALAMLAATIGICVIDYIWRNRRP